MPKSKEVKRKEAIERNKKWESLHFTDKLASLYLRRGASKKQVKKLMLLGLN